MTDRLEPDDELDREQHVAFARQANQETWDLLERTDRTDVENNSMIHAAHAAAFHWEIAGGAAQSARADWLLSRVYAVLGQAEPAQRYARHCLETCEREGLVDFDVAYAYEALARKCLETVAEAARSRWNLSNLGLVHRIGRLYPGDVSVAVAVASEHRAEAFEACRFVIDTVKVEVPIWKKETGPDGQVWIEGTDLRPASPA
jgi:hypothetical protein